MNRATRWLLAASVALLFLAPPAWMLVASFRHSDQVFHTSISSLARAGGWTLQNYGSAWRRADLGRAFITSLVQVGVITGGGLVVNTMAGFAFARLHFRGRELLFGGVIALIILPVEVLAVPLFFTVRDLHLTGDLAAALAGLTLPFVAKAFNIYLLRQHFLLVPRELEEAGVVDGAGVWTQFWSIALPTVRPTLVTVALLDLLTHWSDFLWPLLITTRNETHTVQLGLSNLFTQPPVDWGAILACAVLATLPVLCLFRLAQRFIVPNDVRSGLR